MNTQKLKDDVDAIWQLIKIVVPIVLCTYGTAGAVALCLFSPLLGIPLTAMIFGTFFYRRYVRSES